MDGETLYGIIHVIFLIAGGYFLPETENILQAKHYSTGWLILVWFLYFPFPYIAVVLWFIAKGLDENIKFKNSD